MMTVDSSLESRKDSYLLMLFKTLLIVLAAFVLVLMLYGYSRVGIHSFILLVGLPSVYFIFREWWNLHLVLDDRASNFKAERPESTAIGVFDKMYSRISNKQIAIVDLKGSHVTVVLNSPVQL